VIIRITIEITIKTRRIKEIVRTKGNLIERNIRNRGYLCGISFKNL